MRKVLSYDCGFNSYYVPSNVRGVFTYFISFCYHKCFAKSLKQLHPIAEETGLTVLPKVTAETLQGRRVDSMSLDSQPHICCLLCPLL